jgi:hypothetical protein
MGVGIVAMNQEDRARFPLITIGIPANYHPLNELPLQASLSIRSTFRCQRKCLGEAKCRRAWKAGIEVTFGASK